jgi:type I restriction-modification system DNA methylase subunit
VSVVGGIKDRGVLFARAYLDSCVASVKEGQQLHLLETVREWFLRTDRSSLGSLVASFVGPVLDVLGFVRSELRGNVIALFEDRSREKALSLCYVVNFDENLDQTAKGRNYAVPLIMTLKKTGLRWGILTNGSLWRLYCVKEKAPFETFFQINLGEVVRTRDSVDMTLFADFFGVQAFVVGEKGKCRLDANRQESDEATRQIEEHLQGKMEDMLGKLCMGFIQSEGRKSYTEEEKRAVFNNSIYLLYRILFILYAEARGFLPLQDPEYYEKSMARLTEIAKENHSKGIENPNGRIMWNALREVFNWVNQGNRAMGIPPYNGGLFDDSEKTYLANHVINDAFLSEALFSLGFREEGGNVIPINYNDLSVRHLGGLYEGILEYQLFIAPERMVRRKDKNVYRFIPESQAGKITRTDTVIEKGDVYFSQSSEERKMTGSYYTPEDIVRYIVENSLGQYLADIDKELQALVCKLLEAHGTAVDDRERRSVERFIDKEVLSFLEKKVLSIKILDPAMGSGHFLVNASHFLANYIVESLSLTAWENDSVDTSPLLWRRRVVEKCIFGVDLNELATELAKLSLWLITADNRKPLTFLDHHLRTGNSLLGADLDDLGALPKNGKINDFKRFQTTLYYPIFRKEFIPKVLQVFGEMEFSSEEVEDVERKKEKFKEWEKLKRDLQGVSNTWLATFFGYQMEEEKYQWLLNRAMEGKEVTVDGRVEEIANAPKNSFLHWWLEFPEVFFKPVENNGKCGFDIVLGNPPYGLKDENLFLETYNLGSKDSYGLFIKRGIDLLCDGGIFSMVVSDTWRTIKSHLNLRRYILENTCVSCLVKLNRHAFKEVDAFTIITELKKCANAEVRDDSRYFFFDFWQIHPEKERDFFIALMEAASFDLRKESWKFDSRRAGKYAIRQGFLPKYNGLPIFDGSELIYELVNEDALTLEIEYKGKKVQAREITMPRGKVYVDPFSEVAEVKQGLATGDNKSYLFKRQGAIGAYRLVDESKVLLDSDLLKLTDSEKLEGITDIESRFDGRFIVPYDKGGESDIESGRLSCYYSPSKYFIDWSRKAVNRMKTLTIAGRKKINREGNIRSSEERICARFQNSNFYFKEGITFSMTGLYSPTFRLNSKSVFDVAGTSVFCDKFDIHFLLGVLNSKLAKYFIKAFFMNTVNTHVGAINPLPLAIPTKEIENSISALVRQIIEKQKENPDYEYQKHEQPQIDQLVYELYGLDAALMLEVENWYARRYPKISGISLAEENGD